MKNAFKILKTDLKRITSNWVAAVVVIALIILPSLYAWFNIKAMWDPYGSTAGIKVAVVNEDSGAKVESLEVNVGDEIVSTLKENNAIGWEFVSKDEALSGVTNGDYYASMIIPENFSKDLISFTNGEFQKPKLLYTVNEKSNSIAPKITDKGIGTVKDQISEKVVMTVDGIIFSVLNKFGVEVSNSRSDIRYLIDLLYKLDNDMPEIEDIINKAYNGTISIEEMSIKLKELMPKLEETLNKSEGIFSSTKTYLEKTKETLNKVSPIVKEDLIIAKKTSSTIKAILNNIDGEASKELINSELTKVKEKLTSLNDSIDSLVKLLKSINSVAHNKEIDATITKLEGISQENTQIIDLIDKAISSNDNSEGLEILNTIKEKVNRVDSVLGVLVDDYDTKILPAINNLLSDLTTIADNGLYLSTEAEKSLPNLKEILDIAENGASLGEEKLALIKENFPQYREKIHGYVEKIKDLDDEEKIDKVIELISLDANDESNFLSSPIDIEEEKIFPIPNYGSGMNPFFTVLSMWIGALLLLSLFTTKASNINEGELIKPYEEYLGKYMLFSIMAILQSLVLTLGDIFILKCYVSNKILFVLYGMLISIVFVTIIYTLVSLLKNVGKALAVILLVLQIAASGGTFPIEVMPSFFQRIHPLLPFKYAIGGMREAVGGVVPNLLLKDTLVLLGFYIVFLLIGICGKKYFNKTLEKFSEKLEESGIVGH